MTECFSAFFICCFRPFLAIQLQFRTVAVVLRLPRLIFPANISLYLRNFPPPHIIERAVRTVAFFFLFVCSFFAAFTFVKVSETAAGAFSKRRPGPPLSNINSGFA